MSEIENKIHNTEAPEVKKIDLRTVRDPYIKWVLKFSREIGKKKNSYEKFLLSQSAIEKVLMPRLINFVAEHLKISIPQRMVELNSEAVNHVYLAISHDKELFDLLEVARKKRNNDVIHRKINVENVDSQNDKKLLKAAIGANFAVLIAILDRFGKTPHPIPSLHLYSRGWNDCRKKILETMNAELEDIRNGK
jgi:hypothetical protein